MAGLSETLRGKKVVFVFGSLDLGGAERRGLLLADYLQKCTGAVVQVIGLNDTPGRLSSLCDQLGISWWGVRFHWGLRRRVTSFLRAVQAVRRGEPDIVLSYTRVPNLVCAWGKRWLGAKLLVWNQADEGLLLNGSFAFRVAAEAPDCFISNSMGGRAFLMETYGISPDKVNVVPNGVAMATPRLGRAEWRSQWDVALEVPVVGMVANLSVYKDHDTLVRAWGRVIAAGWKQPPVLVLAGRCDGTEQGLKALAHDLGISEQLKIIGAVDDVAGLLQALDLFVYSSRSEGVPNGVLEAMASGLAVVGTDIPGIREAVGPEGVAYLTPVGDCDAMADRIIELLREKAARQQVGQTLRERVEQSFSLEVMCRRSEDVIASAFRHYQRKD
ncbi:glycosyltransferase family 4 protein [Geomonas nitrogeniifigens]|nr:glycosyltransferase family 4 protein [Geomonas nitrogeniifigens]